MRPFDLGVFDMLEKLGEDPEDKLNIKKMLNKAPFIPADMAIALGAKYPEHAASLIPHRKFDRKQMQHWADPSYGARNEG